MTEAIDDLVGLLTDMILDASFGKNPNDQFQVNHLAKTIVAKTATLISDDGSPDSSRWTVVMHRAKEIANLSNKGQELKNNLDQILKLASELADSHQHS